MKVLNHHGCYEYQSFVQQHELTTWNRNQTVGELVRTLSEVVTIFYRHYTQRGRRIFELSSQKCGDRGSRVVKVLRYKSEGRWLDSRWCHRHFSLT